jgi:DNA-binding SARP family transcriptional activator
MSSGWPIMENDCVADYRRPESPENIASQHTHWAWLYELRPPGAGEALGCAAGGILQARLIRAAASPETPFEDSSLIERLLAAGDTEAACAASIIGINSVLEAGQDFTEFNSWLLRAEQLLERPELSSLGRGALLMQAAIAQLLGPGQLGDILLTLQAFSDAAERADSDAQRIVHASLRGYCEVMSGRLQVADAIVRDALHISPEPGTHPFAKMHLQASLGLINTLRNNPGDARECLDTLISSPDFERLPASLWLLSLGHRLLSLAVANNQPEELEAIAERIRARSIPSHKHYHRSYTHYALGAAALLTGQPDTALFHAETAIEMGERCHSNTARQNSTLLAIQALADLGQHERALNWLDASFDHWQQTGAHLLIASGALEAARLHLELGHPEPARLALARAQASLPPGEPLPCNLRRQTFISALLGRLTPAPSATIPEQPDPRPIQITTFGELCVAINGKKLYDRDWHGTRTKTLLKALIVLGGYKVSAERVCDMLWPDADGDVARNNLKVTLWRLRHLGCEKGEVPLPWVAIQHGYVSLVSGLCRVDCIEFEHNLKAAKREGNPAMLQEALTPAGGNFLANDDSETWIIQHRQELQQAYLNSACLLAELVLQDPVSIDPSLALKNALRLSPNDTRCQRLLAKAQANRV